MKQLAFLLLLLLSVSAPAALADPPDEDVLRPVIAVEGNLWLQVDAGMNLTFMTVGSSILRPLFSNEDPNTTSFLESAMGLAPLVGLELGYNFSPRFGARFRIDYDSRSASKSGSFQDVCLSTDTPSPVEKEYSINVDYLSLSFLGHLNVGNFAIYLGPSFGIPLGRDISDVLTQTSGNSLCDYNAGTGSQNRSVTASLTNDSNLALRISGKIGVGYTIDLAPGLKLVPQLGYDLALSKLLSNSEAFGYRPTGDERPGVKVVPSTLNSELTLNSLQLTLGLRVVL